ncbi:MAG: hypothetical protein RLZZ621_678 [Gemmatimonadota bacterium]
MSVTATTDPAGGDLPVEIERKFLLRSCPPVAAATPPLVVEQGWIPGTAIHERLRRTVSPDGAVTFWRTIKLGRGVTRVEVEEAVPSALFDALWALTRDARVRKRRHVVPDGALRWEIDVFTDRDLVVAEIELEHADASVEFPDWLAPYVEREVTGDPAFLNYTLARPDPLSPPPS